MKVLGMSKIQKFAMCGLYLTLIVLVVGSIIASSMDNFKAMTMVLGVGMSGFGIFGVILCGCILYDVLSE